MIELHGLGVHSEHIYLDQAGDRSHDGLQLALQQLRAGDILIVARLSRLGRSLASIRQVVDHLVERDACLVIGTEPFESMPPARLLQLLTQFQVALVDQAIEDADWDHRQRTDMRHPHHRIDAVQSVWLHQLFDAGVPRYQLGDHFGVSRATAFRAAAEPRS